MQENQRRPLARLRRIDGPVGENSIHAVSLSGWP
jgi:hypothetical protein